MGVSSVVPRMTLMALFCTLSRFSRLDCDRVVRPRPVNDAEYHTLIQQEQMTFDAFRSHGFQRGQSFLTPEFCWFGLHLVRQRSVEVDPEISETVRTFYDFSIEGDCWHYLSHCSVIKGAPQSLRLAFDFGLCLLAPTWHLFQLLLDSSDWCVDVTGCFVDKPVVRKCKHLA